MLENEMAELQARITGEVTRDPDLMTEISEDFGRIVHKTPRFVVRPRTTRDVAETVRFALQHGYTVSTRSQAHSQSGQSLNQDGILIDMRTLTEVFEVHPEERWFEASAGVIWRDVVERLKPYRLIPPVLTNNLNVSVGGTCSMAGLGISSFRYGTQADNCLAIEVVTGTGDIVWCSPEENAELFYHALCGLGQFAIITRVRHRLRPHAPMTRTYYLLYDDVQALLDDARLVMATDRIDYIESWAVPAPQGFRKVGGRKQPFAYWMYPLHITVEFEPDRPPQDATVLEGLRYYRHVHTEDQSIYEFATRLDPLFAIWRKSGYWDRAHPWMEVTLPWSTAGQYMETVLSNLPPVLLGGGHILIWPARGRQTRMPMFRVPDEDFVLGFGILPGIPKEDLEQALELLDQLSDLSIRMGGKRYLSGWVRFDLPRWRQHFGDYWPRVNELKRKYDPHAILNPGFFQYESTMA